MAKCEGYFIHTCSNKANPKKIYSRDGSVWRCESCAIKMAKECGTYFPGVRGLLMEVEK